MRTMLVIVLLSILALGTGCQSLGTYFKDRGNDFIDCFKADVGYGYGIDAHFRCTDFVALGIGYSVMYKAGGKGRHFGTWKDCHMGFPVSGAYYVFGPHVRIDDEMKAFTIIAPYYFSTVGLRYKTPIKAEHMANPKIWNDAKRIVLEKGYVTHALVFNFPSLEFKTTVDSFDIEFGASAVFVGFHVGVSPGQFADFLLGWFGLDIAKDDTKPKHVKKKLLKKKPDVK